MVSVNVDEAALRDMRPDLNSAAAIRLWAQELVDKYIQEMKSMPNRDMISDEMLGTIWHDIDREYQQMDVENDGETMDLEMAREMLHRTIREEYARP